MDAFSEYVPETGRILDGHRTLSVSIQDEQTRVGGAADARGFPGSVPAYVIENRKGII